MYKKLDYIKEVINLLLYAIMYYVTLTAIFSLIDTNTDIFIVPLYIVFISTIFYIVRRFINNKIAAYIVHIILGIILYIPVLFFNISGLKILYFFIEYLLVCIWSINLIKYRINNQYIKQPNLIFGAVLAILLIFTSINNVFIINGILIVFFVVLHFISMYINNIYNYVSFYKINRKFNFKNIFIVNNFYTFLFFLEVFLFTICAKILYLDYLLGKFLSPFINQIRYMFSLKVDFTNQVTYHEAEKLLDSDVTTTNFSTSIIENISNILKIILIIVIAILICYLIYKIRLLFIKYEKFNEEDKYEIINKKIKKNENSISNKKLRKRHKNNNEKIRNIYYTKIMKFSEQIPNIAKLTHLQIEYNLKLKSKTHMKELTKLYEKARYSEKMCSYDDVNKAKSFK